MKKPGKQQSKQAIRDYNQWLKGYRDGYEKAFEIGRQRGREELAGELRELLNVDRAQS